MTKFFVLLLFVFASCFNQQKNTEVSTSDVEDIDQKEILQADVIPAEAENIAVAKSEEFNEKAEEVENVEVVEEIETKKEPVTPILSKEVQQVSNSNPQEKVEVEVVNKEVEKETKEMTEISENKAENTEIIAEQKTEIKTLEAEAVSHALWNSLLKKYVNSKGDVNYKAFKNDVVDLDKYLLYLAENSPEKSWSKNKKLAYYINLYNAATVKLILNNYPTKSIKDLKNPWGKEWVKTGDGVLSLGDIEHKILRKMNEPRIHFAINCASFSCPKLLNEAFTESKMEAQLEATTKDFINDKTRNIISVEKLQLSNIFKWYKKDFTENGSLIDYIKPYTKAEITADSDIDYLKYDWNLNEAK